MSDLNVILFGPPKTGKTMLVFDVDDESRALSHESMAANWVSNANRAKTEWFKDFYTGLAAEALTYANRIRGVE